MSLIIKPGGSFTHRSGASFGVKGSAPAYIISGLEQSHWLASNAVLSNEKVMSITDESGTANAIAVSNARDAYPWTYAASGWQLNGKTLPTMYVSPSDWCIYRADAWADKLSNYTGS